MMNGLNNDYILVSNENQINDFIILNDNTLTILKAMEFHLIKDFPHSKFSLELYYNLGWTTETKLLLISMLMKICFSMGCWIILMIFIRKLSLLLRILKIL